MMKPILLRKPLLTKNTWSKKEIEIGVKQCVENLGMTDPVPSRGEKTEILKK